MELGEFKNADETGFTFRGKRYTWANADDAIDDAVTEDGPDVQGYIDRELDRLYFLVFPNL